NASFTAGGIVRARRIRAVKTSARSRRLRNERGQSATEIAITLSALALLVLGGLVGFWVWSSRGSDDHAKAAAARTAEPTGDAASVDTAALRFAANIAVLRIDDLPRGWVQSS